MDPSPRGENIFLKNKNRNKQNQEKEKINLLQLDFISDSCNRKIYNIIKKYDFKVKVVSRPSQYLKDCLRKKLRQAKHNNCALCSLLPESLRCDDKFLVYKFTCKYCNCFYIGETCRPFRFRYSEHQRSLDARNKTSALSEHAVTHYSDVIMDIDNFKLNIIKRCTNPLATRLSEAAAIEKLRPSLNRQHERI